MIRLRTVRSCRRIRERGQMSRYRRWNELLELLAADGQLQVERAAEVLGVSAATVRRDFDELARQQMLTRIRGGAVAKGVTYDLPLRYKTERHPTEKQRIAAVAAGLVLPGQIAGLNGGTTTTEVARALAVRADLNTGVLEQVTLDIAFLGVDGIDAVAGAMAHHEGEASTGRLLAERATQVVVAADSSKVGRRAFARICAAAEVDILVTDTGIAPAEAARLADA